MTKLEQAARQALGALEVATTPLAKDRQEVLRAITTLREALSGVQALSAAPEAFLKSVIALCSHRGHSPANIEAWDKDDKWIADLWRQAESMLAASPTPPAEQQAAKAAPTRTALPEGWTDCTIEFGNDGPEVVAYGPKRMMTRLAKWLGKYFAQVIAEAAPKAAPGDVLDEALRERDEAEDFINELLDEVLGADRHEWSSAYNRYDAMSDVRERITALHKPAVDKSWSQFQSAMAAPQQEAQEPCGWPADRVRIEKTEKNGWCAYLDIENKHGGRIGTIILCRGINSENAARALAQNWMREFVPNPKQVAAPQQEAQEPTEIPEEIERMAADRYKVVPSHESMFHRWAVVAGTGTQQLYLGREVECRNMARKFAGAFLDGAFVTMQSTSPNPAPAPLSESEYKRGYRDGYDRRDAEVQGALV